MNDVSLTLSVGSVSGATNIDTNFLRLASDMEDALVESIIEGLTPTLVLARDTYCPVQTGALRASGYVDASKGSGVVNGAIGFARDDNPSYAIAVHENPAAFHKPPTGAKFLERAVFEQSGDLLDRIYASLKGKVGL